MKKIVILLSFLCITKLHAKENLRSLLEFKEEKPNKIYYELLAPIAGDAPDLFFIKSRNLKNFSLENNYLSMIEEATHAIYFLETGTYLGDTTDKASRHFPRVITIELSKELFETAKKRFSKKKNITIHQGDSAQLLPKILETMKDKAVFFLDAHFSMGETAKGNENTPIITELNHIKKSKITHATIIIDDIRMFYEPLITLTDNFMQGYPSLNEIVEKILEINPNYQFALVYDTLIAFTPDNQITVSPIVHATTMSRLYDGQNYLIEDVIKAELCIAKAQGDDKASLMELGECWVEKFSQEVGLSRHYALWAGLISLSNQNYDKAKEYLFEAKKRGLDHWRIDWYLAMAHAQCFFDIG